MQVFNCNGRVIDHFVQILWLFSGFTNLMYSPDRMYENLRLSCSDCSQHDWPWMLGIFDNSHERSHLIDHFQSKSDWTKYLTRWLRQAASSSINYSSKLLLLTPLTHHFLFSWLRLQVNWMVRLDLLPWLLHFLELFELVRTGDSWKRVTFCCQVRANHTGTGCHGRVPAGPDSVLRNDCVHCFFWEVAYRENKEVLVGKHPAPKGFIGMPKLELLVSMLIYCFFENRPPNVIKDDVFCSLEKPRRRLHLLSSWTQNWWAA